MFVCVRKVVKEREKNKKKKFKLPIFKFSEEKKIDVSFQYQLLIQFILYQSFEQL